MALNDWPGRQRAEAHRQWPVIESLAARAAEIDAIAGLLLLGSFAAGEPDELSDIDLLVVTHPGRFPEVWEQRQRLSADALLTWDPDPKPDRRYHNWLTRELVKVDCTIIDPNSGGKQLADPIVVLAGPSSIVDRFPRIPRATMLKHRQAIADQQSQQTPNPDEMAVGQLIDWKLSELKNAVRRGTRAAHQADMDRTSQQRKEPDRP